MRIKMRTAIGLIEISLSAFGLALASTSHAMPAEAAPVEFEESDLAKQYPAIAPNRRRA